MDQLKKSTEVSKLSKKTKRTKEIPIQQLQEEQSAFVLDSESLKSSKDSISHSQNIDDSSTQTSLSDSSSDAGVLFLSKSNSSDSKPNIQASVADSDPSHSKTKIDSKGSEVFQLGVHAAQSPNEKKNVSSAPNSNQPNKNSTSQKSAVLSTKPSFFSKPLAAPVQKAPLSTKIWRTLEWIATSALLFAAFFFAVNYQSYSALFVDKLNQIRGQVTQNKYLESLVQNHPASEQQKPLPMTQNSTQVKEQIPPLDIEISPPDNRIIIPRINQNVPIVKVSSEKLVQKDWAGLEADIQEALRDGVVQYPGSANPGQKGNTVVTGHSSYFAWDPGRFKDVFAFLHRVAIGDTIVVYHDQKKYIYQVYDKFEVTPDKVEVLASKGDDRLTLITCTPVGTNWRRLIVLAKPVAVE